MGKRTISKNKIAWIFLILAGLSEVAWAIGIKMTNGFTHLEWSLFTIVFMIGSFFLLAKSLVEIPLGTAYAIFTGTGTAGAAIIGIIALGESSDPLKLISLLVLLTGIVGLKFAEDYEAKKELNDKQREEADDA